MPGLVAARLLRGVICPTTGIVGETGSPILTGHTILDQLRTCCTGVRVLPVLCGRGGPVSDRVGDIGVAVWIALGRAHQGRVTNLAGRWRDFGSSVPGYVADALDRLTSSGQLALAAPDPESCGARPVTVTDTGYARYVTLCQVHNSPDSGRPPADTAPGGRPDTTTPVDSASPAAHVHRGDRSPGGREQPRLGLRRGVVIDVALPVTSVNPITGPELAVALVLRPAHGGGVAKLGDRYLDGDSPAPGYLSGACWRPSRR